MPTLIKIKQIKNIKSISVTVFTDLVDNTFTISAFSASREKFYTNNTEKIFS
jgi:hypothetical protein